MEQNVPFELREGDEVSSPTNHWFVLRVLSILSFMIPIAIWTFQESIGDKLSYKELIYLFWAGLIFDIIFRLKNRRRILFLYNPKK